MLNGFVFLPHCCCMYRFELFTMSFAMLSCSHTCRKKVQHSVVLATVERALIYQCTSPCLPMGLGAGELNRLQGCSHTILKMPPNAEYQSSKGDAEQFVFIMLVKSNADYNRV